MVTGVEARPPGCSTTKAVTFMKVSSMLVASWSLILMASKSDATRVKLIVKPLGLSVVPSVRVNRLAGRDDDSSTVSWKVMAVAMKVVGLTTSSNVSIISPESMSIEKLVSVGGMLSLK